MKHTLHWRLLWPNFVSQCCADRVSLTVTKHLDFCSTFYNADVTSSGSLRTLFLGSKCWMLPRHIHTMENLVPKGNADLPGGIILDALL